MDTMNIKKLTNLCYLCLKYFKDITVRKRDNTMEDNCHLSDIMFIIYMLCDFILMSIKYYYYYIRCQTVTYFGCAASTIHADT